MKLEARGACLLSAGTAAAAAPAVPWIHPDLPIARADTAVRRFGKGAVMPLLSRSPATFASDDPAFIFHVVLLDYFIFDTPSARVNCFTVPTVCVDIRFLEPDRPAIFAVEPAQDAVHLLIGEPVAVPDVVQALVL